MTLSHPLRALIAATVALTPLSAFALGSDEAAKATSASDAPATTTKTSNTPAVSPILKSDAKGPGGRNITAFDRPGQRGIGGYFAQEFTANSDGKVFFDARQLVLQTSAYLHENIFFNAEVEYEHGGNPEDGGEIELEQAWGEYTVADWLNLRAGVLLVPVGRLNVLHDADFRQATTRPLATQLIIPTTWFEPGVGFRGAVTPNDTMEINYEAYVMQGLRDSIDATNGLKEAHGLPMTSNHSGKALTGRVGFSPWLGTEIGLSGYASPYSDDNSRWLTLGAVDALWRNGPFELVGEASLVNTAGGTYKKDNADVTIPTRLGGYYVEGHYSFFPEFLRESFLGRGLGFQNPSFTAFARWGQVDTDFSTVTDADRSEAVIGLNYRPVPNTAVKVEWLRQFKLIGGTSDAFISSLAMGF